MNKRIIVITYKAYFDAVVKTIRGLLSDEQNSNVTFYDIQSAPFGIVPDVLIFSQKEIEYFNHAQGQLFYEEEIRRRFDGSKKVIFLTTKTKNLFSSKSDRKGRILCHTHVFLGWQDKEKSRELIQHLILN